MSSSPTVDNLKRFLIALGAQADDAIVALAAKQLYLITMLIGGGALVTEDSIRNTLNRARAGEPPGREAVLSLLGLYKWLSGVIYSAKSLYAMIAGQDVADATFQPLCKALEFLLKYIQKIVDLMPKFIDKVIGQNPGAGHGNTSPGGRAPGQGPQTPSSAHTGMNNVRGQAATASKSSNPNPWVKSM